MHRIESPRTDDSAIEQEIKAKGLTAPRITPADIEANIVSEFYFTADEGVYGASGDSASCVAFPQGHPMTLLTFCVLTLANGFTVTGESACASPENFDAELGRKIARANAINKIWPLMGYALKEKLHAQQQLAASMAPAPEFWGRYTGTKQVFALPMRRDEYNRYRGWDLPANEEGSDEGYLVEYADGGKGNDSRHAGYISWSPREVFDRSYRPID